MIKTERNQSLVVKALTCVAESMPSQPAVLFKPQIYDQGPAASFEQTPNVRRGEKSTIRSSRRVQGR